MITEATGSPKGVETINGLVWKRTLYCEWDELDDLATEVKQKGFRGVPVSSIDVSPFGGCASNDEPDNVVEVGNLHSGKVQVELEYSSDIDRGIASGGSSGGAGSRPLKPNQKQLSDNSIIEYNVEGSQELFSVKGRGLRWEDNSRAPSDLSAIIRTSLATHQISRKFLEEIDWGFLNSIVGTINHGNVTIPISNIICPQGTCLVNAYSVNLAYVDRQYWWELSITYIQKPRDWNEFYNQDSGNWDILVNTEGDFFYEYANHGALFT